MPRRKVVEANPRPLIIVKLAVLTVLVIAGFIVSIFIKPSKLSAKPAPGIEIDPEGVVAGIANKIDVQPLITTTQEVKKQLASQATELIEQSASEAGLVVNDIVYDHTLKPIVDQIGKLPSRQQERLREQLCQQ